MNFRLSLALSFDHEEVVENEANQADDSEHYEDPSYVAVFWCGDGLQDWWDNNTNDQADYPVETSCYSNCLILEDLRHVEPKNGSNREAKQHDKGKNKYDLSCSVPLLATPAKNNQINS